MMILLLFAALFLLLLLGFPVAFTLGGVAFLFSFFTSQGLDTLIMLRSRIWGIMDNPLLIAVPLFVYMGVMLEKSGLAEDLLETVALLFGRIRGGLAFAVIAVGTLLAASTGIVGATVVTMGLLSLPTMLKRGYSPELATGTIAASGTLGQIIPPSIVLILLASVLEVNIGDVFLAAVLPGLVLVGLMLAFVALVAAFRPQTAPSMPAAMRATFHGRELIRRVAVALLPPIILIVAVLGSIFAGIAPPTEAAAIGALGATVLTASHRRLTRQTLQAVMRETTHLTAMVFLILIGASAFSLVFIKLGGHDQILALIQDAKLSPQAFLLIVMLVIFLAGFFIDFIEITFIFVPIIRPIAESMGMDKTWLAIVIAMNLQTSFLTPPFGFSLFYLKGVAPPSVRTSQIYRGIVPFIGLQLIALAAVIFWPDLALWLPRILAPQTAGQ